ncbi:MAG: PepSY-associated TM helix domain-containing protein, partial [Xanthobacteraceae bacterium]
QAGARAAVIFLPTANANTGSRNRARGAERDSGGEGTKDTGPVWRLQLRSENGEIAYVTIDDRSGTVARLPGPLAGDRAAQWMRWIHEGSHSGPVWQFIVFLTGVFPLVFAVTGVIMWWRGRRSRKAAAANRTIGRGELQAAE